MTSPLKGAPDLLLRPARGSDIEAVVRLLAADPLGKTRELPAVPLPAAYSEAFAAIDRDPNNELVVACREDRVVGVMQLTFVPGLTYTGGWRAQIEGVRIEGGARSQGAGTAMIEWAIARSRDRGCRLVQLTTDKARPDALRFYERLGFTASHEGMKLDLDRPRRGST